MEIQNTQKDNQPNEGLPVEHSGVVVHSSYSAPLPPPAMFAKYEEILPGAADRILLMAEGQSKHRRFIEKTVIMSDVVKSWLGLLFAFLLALAGIGSGMYLVLQDKPISGFFSILTPLGIIVTAFIYQQRQSKPRESVGERDE